MLTLFRINDPFRLIIVLLLLLGIRLPLILGDWDLLVPELHWQLLGESVNQGRNVYSELWDFTGPLAIAIYSGIDWVFGRSAVVYHILALIFVFYQASIFNIALVRRGVYNESTYIPALLYVIFMTISFDFFTLSPVLMANTFLVMIANRLFALNDRNIFDQEIFRIGVYLGIASLIYLPISVFLIVATLGLALFRVTSGRHFGLVLFGFLVVWGIANVYFLFTNNLAVFYEQYLGSLFKAGVWNFVPLQDIAWTAIIPAFVLLVSASKTISERGFINFQTACQRLMILWLIPSALAILISPVQSTFLLMLFAVPLSFFATHWFLLMRKRFLAELYFGLLSVFLIAFCYNGANDYIPKIRRADFSNLFVSDMGLPISGKKVLVLGNKLDHLNQNQLATPYLNWELAKKHFGRLDDYQAISYIFENITEDYPDVIIDESGIAESLFRSLPLIRAQYQEDEDNPKLWWRKASEE